MNANRCLNKSISLIIVTAVLLALFAAPAQPALAQDPGTCIVTSALDDGSAGTLRAALADPTCNTITFADDYIIVVSSPLFVNRSVTIDGVGHTVTLSGGGSMRVLQVGLDVGFRLQNLSVVDGKSTDGLGGGGLYMQEAVAIISNVTFRGNQDEKSWEGRQGCGGGIHGELGRHRQHQ